MVSGHPKSTGIPRVDGLSTGPPDLGCHTACTGSVMSPSVMVVTPLKP